MFKYRLCKRKIKIPSYFSKEEGFDSEYSMSEVTLGFPSVELFRNEDHNYPVFAFLPVCDLGFKFLINCNWSLVTSRESINEHSNLNKYYIDKVAEFFEWAALNDEYVRNNLQFYLPKKTPEMSSWWKLFVNDVKRKLKPVISKIFTNSESKQLRIYNENMKDLIDEKVLEDGANIHFIYPNSTNLNEKDLEY